MKLVSWRASALSVACVMGLQACGGGGGGDTPPAAVVTPTAVTAAALQATQGSTTASVAVGTGGTVSLPLSTAGVTLAAASLANGSAPATGSASVTLTAIDPALAPTSASGGVYLSSDTGTNGQPKPLESFGAVELTLASATGQPLQLTQNATLRIPVRTRSTSLPATTDLSYFDKTLGQWVTASTATLQGNATTGYYYEGTVGRAGTWQASQAIAETVAVTGCVRDLTDQVPSNEVRLYGVGTDHSSLSGPYTLDAQGKFSVKVKRGGLAQLLLVSKKDGVEATRIEDLGTAVSAPTDLGACLRLPVASDQGNLVVLLTSLYQSFVFSLAPSATVDTNASSPALRTPAQACSNGTLVGYTLDGVAGDGAPVVSAGASHQLNVGFQRCTLNTLGLGGVGTSVNIKPPVLTGNSASQFSYTLSDAGAISLQGSTQLSGLLDLSTNLGSSGQYGVSINSDATGTQLLTVVKPAAGTTLTNLGTGRTLTFTGGASGGSLQVSTAEFRFNKLKFKLNGADYEIDGAVNAGAVADGFQITISRGGALVGVVTKDIIGSSGIDPF